MKVPVLTFFNNKGGVGKTSLVYHLSWIFSETGKRVIAVDLDPQANLTAAFLSENEIEKLWDCKTEPNTVYRAVQPLASVEDLRKPIPFRITETLNLLPGDVGLSGFEETLSEAWPNCLRDANLYRPMRIVSAFWQVIQLAVEETGADIVLVDIGPNLGAINRSVLIATDKVVLPLGADLFSLQGLSNLGPTLANWKRQWIKRMENWKEHPEETEFHPGFSLPTGEMNPIGYVCQQYGVRWNRPVQAYDKWMKRIPQVYRTAMLGAEEKSFDKIDDDPYCLALLKHYRSLIPMAQEVRKPIFDLTSADGAIGSHSNAVRSARNDFLKLADRIQSKIGFSPVSDNPLGIQMVSHGL